MKQAEANALPHHDEGCAVTQDGDCDCSAPQRVAMEALTSVLYDAAGAAVAVILRVGEFDDGDADPSFFIDTEWMDWLDEAHPELVTGQMVDLFEDTDNVYQWITFIKPKEANLMAVTINVESGSFKGEHQDDCPACGHEGVSMWAFDGESDLADYWQCVPGVGGCGASGSILKEGSTTLTQNDLPID